MPLIRSDTYLAVEAVLTDDEKERFLDLAYRANPHCRGAQIADLLDMMAETDCHLELTEPICERHRDWPRQKLAVLDLCIFVAVYACRLQAVDEVEAKALEILGRLDGIV